MKNSGATIGLFRRASYGVFFVTATMSRVTGTMFNVAIVLLLIERTGSTSAAGLVVAAGTLPAAVTGPALGAWLDASRRPRLLMGLDQGTSALSLALILACAGHVPIGVLAFLAIGYGATRPLSIGGFSRVIPELVSAPELPTANALESLSFNVAFIVGPLAASLLAASGGASFAVLVEVLLTAVVTVSVVVNPSFDARSGSHAGTTLRNAWIAGWAVLRDRPLVRAAVLLTGAWAAVTGTYVVLFPILSARTLGSADRNGMLWTASSIGSIVGSFAGRRVAQFHSRRSGFFPFMGLAGVGMAWWAFTDSWWILVPVAAAAAAAGPAVLICAQILQTRTPSESRGSVFTTLGSLNLTASAAGAALAGHFGSATSVQALVVAVAVATACLGLVGNVLLCWSDLRGKRQL